MHPSVHCVIHDPLFADMESVFRNNFVDGLEREGAAFAVYYKGELVVDMWGGWKRSGEEWTEHTRTVLFSCSKSMSAIILAYVLDRTDTSYHKLLADFWPEYAQNGKERTTIMHVVSHQAGIPYTDQEITREDVSDWKSMSRYFERAHPIWTPGTKTGYHALTIGFLMDQIVRRLDDHHRGIVQVFNEDFREKYGLHDISFGLDSIEDDANVATLSVPTEEDVLKEGEMCPESLRRYNLGDNLHTTNLYKTWDWIRTCDYNVLKNRLLPMPSNMGIGTARDLAHMHSLIATKKILSEKMHQLYTKPYLEHDLDICNGYEEHKGYGWQSTKSPQDNWIFGHSGFGGQNVRVDVHNELSYAYLCNGLKIADADLVIPFAALQRKLYEIVDTLK